MGVMRMITEVLKSGDTVTVDSWYTVYACEAYWIGCARNAEEPHAGRAEPNVELLQLFCVLTSTNAIASATEIRASTRFRPRSQRRRSTTPHCSRVGWHCVRPRGNHEPSRRHGEQRCFTSVQHSNSCPSEPSTSRRGTEVPASPRRYSCLGYYPTNATLHPPFLVIAAYQ